MSHPDPKETTCSCSEGTQPIRSVSACKGCCFAPHFFWSASATHRQTHFTRERLGPPGSLTTHASSASTASLDTRSSKRLPKEATCDGMGAAGVLSWEGVLCLTPHCERHCAAVTPTDPLRSEPLDKAAASSPSDDPPSAPLGAARLKLVS